MNNQLMIENFMTSSSLFSDQYPSSVYDTGKKTQKKSLSKMDLNDNEFCVPQTPRPILQKKLNPLKKAYSMDLSKVQYGR